LFHGGDQRMLRFCCTGKPEDASLFVPWGRLKEASLLWYRGTINYSRLQVYEVYLNYRKRITNQRQWIQQPIIYLTNLTTTGIKVPLFKGDLGGSKQLNSVSSVILFSPLSSSLHFQMYSQPR